MCGVLEICTQSPHASRKRYDTGGKCRPHLESPRHWQRWVVVLPNHSRWLSGRYDRPLKACRLPGAPALTDEIVVAPLLSVKKWSGATNPAALPQDCSDSPPIEGWPIVGSPGPSGRGSPPPLILAFLYSVRSFYLPRMPLAASWHGNAGKRWQGE